MLDTLIADKQMRTLNSMNPYGSAANHPGWLGKIEHGLAKAGNIAGDIVAPGVMANIPGTDMNKQMSANAQDKELASLAGEQADIGLKNAQAHKAGADSTPKEEKWSVVPGMLGPQGQPIQQEQNSGQIRYAPDITGVAPIKPQSEDDRAKFVNDWFKDPANFVNGKAPEKTATNEVKANQAYTDSTQQPTLMQEPIDPKDPSKGYRMVAARPGMTVSSQAAKPGAPEAQQASVDKMYKGKTLVFSNPDGTRDALSYDEAKKEGRNLDEASIYTAQEGDKLRQASNSYGTTVKAFDKYQKALEKAKLTFEDRKAMGVLTTHQEDLANDYVTKSVSGVLDTLFGEPLTGYSSKAMGGIMNKDQYDALSPAGREVLADYFSAMMAHFQNIKQTQGSMPRNPTVIRTEMNAVPLPYLSGDEAKNAFANYRDRVEGTSRGRVRFKGEEDTDNNSKPAGTQGTKTPALPPGLTLIQ
jgi:hypothetical protein